MTPFEAEANGGLRLFETLDRRERTPWDAGPASMSCHRKQVLDLSSLVLRIRRNQAPAGLSRRFERFAANRSKSGCDLNLVLVRQEVWRRRT